MKSFSPTNLLSCRLIGAVGLGVALLGLPQSAEAATVSRGTDYVATPSEGALFNFVDTPLGAGIVTVTFGGLAIGTPTPQPNPPNPPNPDGGYAGEADTVVNRLDDVEAPYLATLPVANLINGTLPANNVTPIQIVKLSLQGTGNYAGKIFVGLDPAKVSGGKMAIAHNQTDDTGGIWTSYFGIHGMAIIANNGVTLTPTGNDYVHNLIVKCGTASDYQCVPFSKGFEDFNQTITLDGGSVGPEVNTGFSFKSSNRPWSHTPSLDQIQGVNLFQTVPPDPNIKQNFYLTGIVIHDAGGGIIHTVQPQPVPEPLTILGSLTAVVFGAAFEKKRGKKSKKDQQD